MKIVRIVRNVEFSRLFDTFFITAASTILLVRFYLKITGYPQIGNHNLHISHLLPGTLLMLLAILTLLAAVNRAVRNFSAVVAGIGFGLSWDELGKFITSNNNYFFKPTLGLIYLTFVIIYLIGRYTAQKRLTQDDYLANVIDLLKEAAIKNLDPREYEYAQEMMLKVSPHHTLYAPTLEMLKKTRPNAKEQALMTDKIAEAATSPLRYLSLKPYFPKLIISVATLYGIANIFLVYFFFYGAFNSQHVQLAFLRGDESDLIGAASALLTVGCSALASYEYWLGRRTAAYKFFEAGLLIEILVGQDVLFFKNAKAAIVGLFITLLLLANLKLLRREEAHHRMHTKKLPV